MARGILFGALWGFVVGGIILGVASLLGEVSGAERPDAAVMEVPAGSRFDQAGTDEPVAPPTDETSFEAPADAPLVTSADAPVAPTLDDDVRSSTAVPDTSGDVAGLATPPAGASDSGVNVQVEEVPEGVDVSPTPPQDLGEGPTAEVQPAEPVEPPDAPEGDVVPEDNSVAEEVAEEAETADQNRPRASAGGFGNLAEGVTINRAAEGAEDDAEEATAEAQLADDAPAIEAFAETDNWVGLDERPLLSIIVIDEAADASRLPAFASFDAPIAFAVPGDAPGASDAVAAYRAAGHEVVLLATIPVGARPSDVEVAMEAQLRAVPEAVAVLDGTFAGFQGNRDVAGQVSEILAGTGHGLVTFSQGLNAASQIATQAGVPVGTVFRDLDGEGQGDTVIRRFLDQAAFRAGQDGQAILVARTRGETISALLIWQQQDRANRVNIAPLSALLLANEQG